LKTFLSYSRFLGCSAFALLHKSAITRWEMTRAALDTPAVCGSGHLAQSRGRETHVRGRVVVERHAFFGRSGGECDALGVLWWRCLDVARLSWYHVDRALLTPRFRRSAFMSYQEHSLHGASRVAARGLTGALSRTWLRTTCNVYINFQPSSFTVVIKARHASSQGRL